jgi:hypothetical protein
MRAFSFGEKRVSSTGELTLLNIGGEGGVHNHLKKGPSL